MKNTLKYTFLSAVFLGFVACDVDNALPEIKGDAENTIALEAGSADFSKYVAIGASFTAGFTDGALFKAGQGNSFPNIMAKKFAMVGGGDFTQPLMNDNIGGFLIGGQKQGEPRLFFDGSGPVRLPVMPTTEISDIQAGLYSNLGIPGIKSFHLGIDGYGSWTALLQGKANPYFVRMASNPATSVVKDAVAQMPTFFSLSEIGGNDVLDYALSGGTGIDRTGDVNVPSYGPNDITDPNVFAASFSGVVDALELVGAKKGVVANLPYITSLPFFTTVPNNALVLDVATATNLTGFFKVVEGILIQGLVAQNVPLANAQALAAQYAITFNKGPNRWLIDVPVSATNPLGFRQMTEDELLLLTIDQGALKQGYGSVVLTPSVLQVLGILQAGGTPTPQQAGLVLAAVSGLDDKDVLDADELNSIKTATDAYNTTITTVAAAKGLAMVDFKGLLEQASTTGIDFNSYHLNTSLVTGGLVGLDGIHLTARGYALMANKMLEAIDKQYGSNFTTATNGLAKAGDFPTNYSPLLR